MSRTQAPSQKGPKWRKGDGDVTALRATSIYAHHCSSSSLEAPNAGPNRRGYLPACGHPYSTLGEAIAIVFSRCDRKPSPDSPESSSRPTFSPEPTTGGQLGAGLVTQQEEMVETGL